MSYDNWKTTEPDPGEGFGCECGADDERDHLYAENSRLRASHDRLLKAAKEIVMVISGEAQPHATLAALEAAIAAAEEPTP